MKGTPWDLNLPSNFPPNSKLGKTGKLHLEFSIQKKKTNKPWCGQNSHPESYDVLSGAEIITAGPRPRAGRFVCKVYNTCHYKGGVKWRST